MEYILCTIQVEEKDMFFKLDIEVEVTVVGEKVMPSKEIAKGCNHQPRLCGPDQIPLNVRPRENNCDTCLQKHTVKNLQQNLLGLPAIKSLPS